MDTEIVVLSVQNGGRRKLAQALDAHFAVEGQVRLRIFLGWVVAILGLALAALAVSPHLGTAPARRLVLVCFLASVVGYVVAGLRARALRRSADRITLDLTRAS